MGLLNMIEALGTVTESIAKIIPNELSIVDNQLYLSKGDKLISSGIDMPSGSGGGGSGSVIVTDLMPSTDFSVASGAKEVWVRFSFEPARPTEGTAYIKTLDGGILGSKPVQYGENKINIAEFITSSFNPIVIICTDKYGNSSNSLVYNITTIALSLSISFSDAVAVTTSSFTIPYRLQGDGKKIIHFILDGEDFTEEHQASDINTNKVLSFKPTQPHGVYSLKIYAEHEETGQKSNEIYEYKIMYAIGATPLISSVYQVTQAEEYEPLNIPFAVYHATNSNPQVDLIVSYDGVEYSRSQMYAPRGKLVKWPIRVSKQGRANFTISYGGAQVTHHVEIVKSSMNVTVRAADLAFELKAEDKSNNSHREWVSNVGNVKVDLQNINWDVEDKTFVIVGEKKEGEAIAPVTKKTYAIGTGWRTDEDNNTALRLSGDARAIVEFKPFSKDWTDRGATFEMEFAIRDVNDRDAVAISCMNNNIGFKVTADTASLIRNNVPLVKCNYVDDEKIRIAFVVENYKAPAGNDVKLITAYLNGVLSSAVKFTDSDKLYQNPAAYITVGSSDCSIDLYMMRFYDAPLTYNEIRDNYIADARRNDLWADNNIYVNNAINYNKLESKIPILRMTGWPLPSTKNETKPVSKGGLGMDRRVDVVYTNKSPVPVIQEQQVKIHVQGTSSEGYNRKNWDLDFENSYEHAEGQMPTDYFCMKADYAEATGTHNTGHANYVHNFYTSDEIAKDDLFKFSEAAPFTIDPRARTTVYGFPCVIFHKKYASDSEFEFAGKYNFNFSKDSESVFGFTATDDDGNLKYPKAQSWEFAENKYAPCKFLTDPNEIPDGDGSDENPGWEKCFEDRYLRKGETMEDFKRMYSWVYYTDKNKATGSDIDPFSKQPIGEYVDPFDNNIIHTHDTPEYRLAKFRKEFQEHFHLGFTLVYYIYTFVMLMVDQRAKNQFLTSWDGQIWGPWLYDNDTSFGINNKGSLIFDYYHEDGDQNGTLDQTDVYNGKDSVLWVNFAEAFAKEIQTAYGKFRSGNDPLLSYDRIIDNFITNHSDKWSISIYNEDAEYKYIATYRNGEPKGDENLYQVRGTGEEHLKYFVKNRLMYCDSKWKTGDFVNKDTNTIIMRINAPDVSEPSLQPSTRIAYKTFSNMYAGVGYGAKSGVTNWGYTNRNTLVEFVSGDQDGQNDLDTYIFGASEISSLEDLSLLYCGAVNVSSASKLTRLIIGNEHPRYNNNLLTDLSLSNNRLLRELNICNCTALKGTIDLSLCPDIQKIYAKGSGISGVQLPTSGFLKEITLPATISNLSITKQNRIEKFECEGYGNVTTLKIDDSRMVIRQDDDVIVSTDRFPLQEILLGCNIDNLVSVSITNIKWNVDSEDILRTIINKLSAKQGFVFEGSVYLPQGVTVSDDLKILVHQKFPNLNVIDNDPIFYIDYYDYDNSLWGTETVRAGNDAKGPSNGNPSNFIDEERGFRYLFVEWENLPQNVQQNCSIGATWQTQYAIKFYNGDDLFHTQWSDYGKPAEDPVENGKDAPIKDGTSDMQYRFAGWDNLPQNVQNTVSVYALFDTYWAARFYNERKLYLTEWIIDGGKPIEPKNYFEDYVNPTKASTAQYDYTFSEWDGDFDTVMTAARNFSAVHSHTTRRYDVHFYNGDVLMETRNVQYGGSTTYTGQTPTKQGVENQEEYVFKGWSPEPTNIQGETNCYAVYKFTGYLFGKLGKTESDDQGYGTVDNPNWSAINSYWDVIAMDIEKYTNDTLSESEFKIKYPIGGRMIIPIALDDGTNLCADVEIIAYNHDFLADNSGMSPLTFFCKDLLDLQKSINWTYDTNAGGWEATDIRKFLNNELFNSLPTELKNRIKLVSKISDGGYTNKSLVTTEDKCWLASCAEVGLLNISGALPNQGSQYTNIFYNDDSREKTYYGGATTERWWLRSSYYSNNSTNAFWRITVSGGSYSESVGYPYYIAFGFCI